MEIVPAKTALALKDGRAVGREIVPATTTLSLIGAAAAATATLGIGLGKLLSIAPGRSAKAVGIVPSREEIDDTIAAVGILPAVRSL